MEELINSLNDLHVDKIENKKNIDIDKSENMDISIIDKESGDDKEIESVIDIKKMKLVMMKVYQILINDLKKRIILKEVKWNMMMILKMLLKLLIKRLK